MKKRNILFQHWNMGCEFTWKTFKLF